VDGLRAIVVTHQLQVERGTGKVRRQRPTFYHCATQTTVQSRSTIYRFTTAAAPAREVEAVVRSPTNMVAAKIAVVDFNKMTSK